MILIDNQNGLILSKHSLKAQGADLGKITKATKEIPKKRPFIITKF